MLSVDYKGIITRSWHLTRSNKWLWVYGLLLAVLGGSSTGSGGGGSGGSSGSASGELPKLNEQLPQESQEVLGAFTDAATAWFQSIPPAIWISLSILFFAVVIIGILIIWVARSWAQAGLISGLDLASDNLPSTLSTNAARAKHGIKPLITYSVMNFAMMTGLILFAGIIIFTCTFIPVVGLFIAIPAGIFLVIGLLIALFFINIMSVFAERLIVLHDVKPADALKQSFLLSKKYFIETILMGLINNTIGCTAGCLTTISAVTIFIPVVILGFIMYKNTPLYLMVTAACISFILFITLIQFFQALIIVWRYGNWNEFFRLMMSEEEKQV